LFGLLRHLVELSRSWNADARLENEAVPLLDGAGQTVTAGRLSS
jgi:selenide,water dikinase